MMKLARSYIQVDEKIFELTNNWIRSQKIQDHYEEMNDEYNVYHMGTHNYITAFAQVILGDNDKNVLRYLADNFKYLTKPLDILSSCYALNYFKYPNMNNTC